MLNSGWRVEVDASTPFDWSEMLDGFDDANIYQTWSYGLIRWGAKNLSHIVVKHNGGVIGMAQLRIIRPTRFKFGMAYLRWGPLCERRGKPLDLEALRGIARALEEEYVEKRRLLLHVIPNAFYGSLRAELFESAFSKFKARQLASIDRYRTSLLDLSPPLEELRKRLDKKWRNQLTRAERNNLKVTIGTGSDDFLKFRLIYEQMKTRKGFETTVDIDEFRRIQDELPEKHRLRVLICEDAGVPVAGLVASAMGSSAIYLFGATSDSGLRSKGAYLLQWTLLAGLKDAGCRLYDLGGIDPERNPGVYHFKSGLSGLDVTQLAPMMACRSQLSSAVIKVSLALHNSLRHRIAPFQANRPLKQLPAKG